MLGCSGEKGSEAEETDYFRHPRAGETPRRSPSLSPEIRCPLDNEKRQSGHHPPDPPRRRAVDGQVPRDPFRSQVYLRYFSAFSLERRVAHERLLRICFCDYDSEMALVAELADPDTGERSILAVGRMSKLLNGNEAEVAVLVSDRYQKLGLGHELLRRIIQVARDEKLSRVSGEMLADNVAMQVLLRRLGFSVRATEDFTSEQAFLDL
jgi:GNAT superfamily N-acetyltransferase